MGFEADIGVQLPTTHTVAPHLTSPLLIEQSLSAETLCADTANPSYPRGEEDKVIACEINAMVTSDPSLEFAPDTYETKGALGRLIAMRNQAPATPCHGEFRWDILDIDKIDPVNISSSPEVTFSIQQFEPLVNQYGNTFLGGLAYAWENVGSSTDMSDRWRFYLRPNARFSDGSPITANDVLYTYHRLLTPSIGHNLGTELVTGILDGANTYYKNPNTSNFDNVGIQKRDLHTIELRFTHPLDAKMALTYAALPFTGVVPRRTIEKFGNQWTRPEKIVTSGAFYLSDSLVLDHHSLKKNPYYWDTNRVALCGATMYVTRDIETSIQYFDRGLREYVFNIPFDKWANADFRNKHDGTMKLLPIDGQEVIIFDLHAEGFPKDPQAALLIRRAIAMAIDQERLTKHVHFGTLKDNCALIPATSFDPSQLTSCPLFDPEKATQLMAEAGHPNGRGLPTLTILTNGTAQDIHVREAEYIQRQLKGILNIEVDIENVEFKTYISRANNPADTSWEITRQGWVNDIVGDPLGFLNLFVSNNPNNKSKYQNKNYDRLIQEAQSAASIYERDNSIKSAYALLMQDLPAVGLYTQKYPYLISASAKGFNHSYSDAFNLKYVSTLSSLNQ